MDIKRKSTIALILLFASLGINAQQKEQIFTYVDPTDTDAEHKVYLKYSDESKTSLMVIAAPKDSAKYDGDFEIPPFVVITDTVNYEEHYTTSLPVNKIDQQAFSGTSITSIKMGHVSEIGRNAFYNCTKLTKVYFWDLEHMFNMNYENEYANPLYIAKHLYIGSDENEVKTLKIPTSISFVPQYAFAGGENIESVFIPASVREIQAKAFLNCKNLKQVQFASVADLIHITFGSKEANPLYYSPHIYIDNTEAEITEINIPDDVIAISPYAFINCEGITKVSIPISTISIGNDAFANCKNIYSVNYPSTDALSYIAYGNENSNPLRYAQIVFVNGIDQSSLTLQRNVNAYAFYGAKWLEKVTICNGVQSIGTAAFRECINLKTVIFESDGLESIGNDAFNGCTSMEKVKLPSSLQTIGVAAFRNCWQLKQITIPESTTSIGNETFFGCGQLEKAVINAKISTTPKGMFSSCTKLADVYLNKNIRVINESAFSGCASLISLPKNGMIREIYNEAFKDCNGLKELTLPDSIKTIGKRAFQNCKNLTTLFIPKGVSELNIALEAFAPSYLKNVYAYPMIAPTAEDSSFGENTSEITLFYDSLSTGYDQAPWSKFKKIKFDFRKITYFVDNDTIHSDSIQVGDKLTPFAAPTKDGWDFSGWIENIPSVMPGENLEIHGYFSTRRNIDGLTYLIELTKSDTKVLADTASYKPLTDIVVPELITIKDSVSKDDGYEYTTHTFHVTAIEPRAFENCEDLQEITLPNSLIQIGNGAFMGTGLTSFTFPNSITTVVDSLFLNCENLATVNMPEATKAIDKAAFYGCSSLIMEALPSQLETIKDFAFSKSGITDIRIPKSITSMGNRVFESCAQLDSVFFDNEFSLSTLPDYSFLSCRRLKGFKLSPLTKTIGTGSFQGCNSIKQLVLEEGIKEISPNAFYECVGMESVMLPKSIERFGNNAFGECNNITQITINDRVEAPIAAASTFSDDTYNKANLYVTNDASYKTKSPWKRFNGRIFTISYNPIIYIVDDSLYHKEDSIKVGATITYIPVPKKEERRFSGWKPVSTESLPAVMPNDTVVVAGEFEYKYRFIDEETEKTIYKDSLFYKKKLPDYEGDISAKLKKDGYRYEIIDTILTMPANDTIINVRYIPTETDFTVDGGLTYHIFTEGDDIHAELMSDRNNKAYEKPIITVPDSIEYLKKKYPVTAIRTDAFKACYNLTSVTLPSIIKSIGTQAFRNCANLLKIEIPASVTTLGDELFWGCKNLQEVVFLSDNNITELPANIFQDCDTLASIELPSSIQYIYGDAFRGCRNLLEIEIPQAVDSIGERVFNGCEKLEKIYISNKNKLPKATDETFDNKTYDVATLYVSRELQENLTAPWDNFMTEIGDATNIEVCAQPVIDYVKGKLQFTCDTPGATITSEIKIADAQKTQNPEQQLTQTYVITAYASAKGYKRSPVTTVTLKWKSSSATLETSDNFGHIEYQIEDEEGQVGLPGDMNGDKKITAEDAVLILKQITGNKEENNNGE